MIFHADGESFNRAAPVVDTRLRTTNQRDKLKAANAAQLETKFLRATKRRRVRARTEASIQA